MSRWKTPFVPPVRRKLASPVWMNICLRLTKSKGKGRKKERKKERKIVPPPYIFCKLILRSAPRCRASIERRPYSRRKLRESWFCDKFWRKFASPANEIFEKEKKNFPPFRYIPSLYRVGNFPSNQNREFFYLGSTVWRGIVKRYRSSVKIKEYYYMLWKVCIC